MKDKRSQSQLSFKDVEYLARLSNLKINDDEVEDYPKQLSESLEYVQNLEEVNTDDVPETFYTTDAKNVMQEDVVDEDVMLTQKEALANAKKTKDGYFVVGRIL